MLGFFLILAVPLVVFGVCCVLMGILEEVEVRGSSPEEKWGYPPKRK